MPSDLFPERPVSSRKFGMTLLDLITLSKRPEGISILWAERDHRLLRVCKMLERRGYLHKETLAPGKTTFYIAEKHRDWWPQ